MRSMAPLADPFAWMARAIGFHSFGGIAAVPEGAWVPEQTLMHEAELSSAGG